LPTSGAHPHRGRFSQAGHLLQGHHAAPRRSKGLHIVIDSLAERFIGEHIDAIVGIESRGFIFGSALAARLNASFVPVRKTGRLPAAVGRVSYDLEYGSAELEMHQHSIHEGAKVLVVDDLLATGGTASATAQLVRRQGGYVASFAFVIELDSSPVASASCRCRRVAPALLDGGVAWRRPNRSARKGMTRRYRFAEAEGDEAIEAERVAGGRGIPLRAPTRTVRRWGRPVCRRRAAV
jgi:adenine phosphoribosyltransferase